jgi:hypothetical protein
MNHISFQAIAVASILGAAAMISAQTAATGSTNADSVVEIKVVKSNPDGRTVIRETDDQIIIYKKDLSRFGLPRDEAGKLSPKNGYGIAGGPVPGFIALDFGPINDLIKASNDLNGRTFGSLKSTGFTPIATMGGMGYLGFGNGLRLGGGGTNGDRYYLSDAYAQDSIVSFKVSVEFGGFLVEKAFSKNHLNLITGTMIGGGSMTATVRRTVRGGNTAFDLERSSNGGESKTASFFLMELHGGFTYSIVPFLHLGADAMLPMFYSANGFETYTNSFVTVNPALRIRFIFGNLG